MGCNSKKMVCGTVTDDCLIKLKSKCVLYDGPSTSNIGYTTNMPLTDLLLLIDQKVGTGGGLVSVSTINSPTIAFSGNGSPGNPLSATVIGGLTPTLAQVTGEGNTTPDNIAITGASSPQMSVQGTSYASFAASVGANIYIAQVDPDGNVVVGLSGVTNNIDTNNGILRITTGSGLITHNIFNNGNLSGANAIDPDHFVTLQQLDSISGLTLGQVTNNGNNTSDDIIIFGTGATEASQIQIGNLLTESVATLQVGYNSGADEGVAALLLQGENRNQIIFSNQNPLEFALDTDVPIATFGIDGRITASSYEMSMPSKIEYLTDTDGNEFGALEVYRTILNPDAKAPQSLRSVLRVSSNEVGHEDKELTSVYGGLHITADNTGNYTNATEGLIAVAGTASTLGGTGNISLMSCFGALGGNAPTGAAIIDRFAFFKVTSYDQNLNTGKVTKIAGFAQPKLSIPGATGAIQWFSGMGDATTSAGMLGNQTWPTGNWNMYDASGYSNYLSGTTLVSTLTDDTTSKLQVGGTTRTAKVVGGTLIGDTLSLQNYTSGTTGAVIDQYGITVGGGTASTNTLFKATRAFVNPTSNIHGFRAEHSVSYTTAATNNALFGGFFVPTIAATNTQNWTNPVSIQGISVAPTITNGATGTISAIVAGTFDLNFRAPGVTVTNAIGVRVYVDPLAVSPMTNVALMCVGVEGIVSGNWGIYNAAPYPSYLGNNNILINTTTDSGTGAKLQVNGAAEVTKCTITNTTGPQLTVAYNGSNLFTTSVSSAGVTTFNTTGTFNFSKRASFTPGITINNTSSNIYIGDPFLPSASSNFAYQYGGVGTTDLRVGFGGDTTATLTTNGSYSGVVVGKSAITAAATGTHPVVASLGIISPTITTGASTITNAATLYVDNAPTGGVTNSAIYVAAGDTRLQNLYATTPTYSSGGFTNLVHNTTTGRIESTATVTQTLDTVTTAGNTTTNAVTVGALTTNGLATVNAAITANITTIATGTTLGATVFTAVGNTLSANCTINLPTGVTGRMYFVRRSSPANTLTLQAGGSDTFDTGSASLVVTNAVIIQLQGNTWWILSQF